MALGTASDGTIKSGPRQASSLRRNMNRSFKGIVLSAIIFGGLALVPAHASLLFNIQCSAPVTCGSTVVGTIGLTQVDAFTVQIVETVSAPDGVIKTGSHNTLTFSLDDADGINDPSIVISNLTPGFVPGVTTHGGSATNSTWGSYDYSVNCLNATPLGCGNGSNHPLHTLSFDVQIAGASTPLSLSDFVSNGKSFFATDLCISCGAGSTGPWGDNGGGGFAGDVPEPVSFVLLGTGLGLLGMGRMISNRRRLSKQR
jgi:hypothetical protein